MEGAVRRAFAAVVGVHRLGGTRFRVGVFVRSERACREQLIVNSCRHAHLSCADGSCSAHVVGEQASLASAAFFLSHRFRPDPMLNGSVAKTGRCGVDSGTVRVERRICGEQIFRRQGTPGRQRGERE